MSIIYIAGKIAGEPYYCLHFSDAERKLTALGHVVLNPAVLAGGMKPADYMRICFAMIDTADAVALLPDWAESRGARLEKEYCEYIGKKVIAAPK